MRMRMRTVEERSGGEEENTKGLLGGPLPQELSGAEDRARRGGEEVATRNERKKEREGGERRREQEK